MNFNEIARADPLTINDGSVYDMDDEELYRYADSLMSDLMHGAKFAKYPSVIGEEVMIDPLGYKKMCWGHIRGKMTIPNVWPPRSNGRHAPNAGVYHGKYVDELVASIKLIPNMLNRFKVENVEKWRQDRENLMGIDSYYYLIGNVTVNGIKLKTRLWIRKYDHGDAPCHYYFHSALSGELTKDYENLRSS